MGVIPEQDPMQPEASDRLLIRKIANGTANLSRGSAMTRMAAVAAVLSSLEVAADLFEGGMQLLGTGNMGIGNTTPSAAIEAVVTGCQLDETVGRRNRDGRSGAAAKKKVIRHAIDVNRPDPADGLDILSKIGGFEFGGIAGCILAGAYYKRPIAIYGFISTAGTLIAHILSPLSTAYLFAGHCSEEPGHRHMLEDLKPLPILDLGLRFGEGTGGALAMGIMEAAIRIFREMQTFEEAGEQTKKNNFAGRTRQTVAAARSWVGACRLR